MDSLAELADLLRPSAGLRVVGGTVVQVVDATHVLVDLGDKTVTAYTAQAVAAGSAVRLLVGAGVCEVQAAVVAAPTWTAPTLGNGWVNFLSGVAPVAYRRVGDVVELRGAIRSGTLATTVFTLPVGFRPTAGNHLFAVVAGPGGARLDVSSDGTVVVRAYYSSGTSALVSLAGVRFAVA